jgi:hypothetical protein
MQHARLHLGDAEITLRASASSSSCALRSTVTLRTIPSEPHGYTALDVILFGMLRILQLTVHPFGKLHGAASVKFERALNETVGNMVMGQRS